MNKLNALKSNIKEFAYQLGFNEVGFARYKLVDEFHYYLQWLEKGYHASMDYLEGNLEKRKDIANILPEVKTVIVFAHSYYTGIPYESKEFKISRYAWGLDYHDIIKVKIDQVVDYIKKFHPDLKYKVYVDTGPILEKYWAVEAGIGWQGKNSLVLSRELGSYFFLGLLLLDLEFEPDSKVRDFCGKCTKCMEACPTGAIVEPKVIDSNKCISFWTIEKKKVEEIPEQIDLNGWIFGCDICQEVCPWNSKVKLTNEISFYPRDGRTYLDAETLRTLTPENFKEIFRKSPIKRAKFEGLIKNYHHIIRRRNETK
jgi:epoxyqueuosine reductase